METSSRTFKFRVWNKTYKEMFYPKGSTKNGEYEEKIYLQLDGVLMGDFKLTGLVDCSDDYVIQQFTGAQDSEGVDIYEGDLVEYDSSLLEVKFENSPTGSSFVLVSEDPEDLGYSLTTYSCDYKVVGNIFEK